MSSSFVFKDHEFLSSAWTESLAQSCSGAAAAILTDHVATGGRGGGGFRQHIQQWGKMESDPFAVCVVLHTTNQATYSLNKGAIQSIDFDCTLMNIDKSTKTSFALLIEQNNRVYVSKKTMSAKRNKWRSFSLHNLHSKDFRKVPTTETPEGAQEELPNFSVLGGEIAFGYATICSSSKPQDEAASGIDFWRVIINPESETTQQGMRVMQLEHNASVLLQDLADARKAATQAQQHLATQRVSTSPKDNVGKGVSRAEVDQLQAKVDTLRHELESERAEHDKSRRDLSKERTRCKDIENTIRRSAEDAHDMRNQMSLLEAEIEKLKNQLKQKEGQIQNMMKLGETANAELAHALKDALVAAEETKSKQAELLEFERARRLEQEQTHSSSIISLQSELRNLYKKMDADVSRERDMRLRLEDTQRSQLSRLEEETRTEKIKATDAAIRERAEWLKKEESWLEEKRNLEFALQATSTKAALIDKASKQLSSQLLTVSSLHKSEAARAAELESALQQERENREFLEIQVPKEEEDWEVVDEQ